MATKKSHLKKQERIVPPPKTENTEGNLVLLHGDARCVRASSLITILSISSSIIICFKKDIQLGNREKQDPLKKKTKKKNGKKEKLIRSNVRSRIQSLPVEEFFSFFLNMQKDFLLIQTFLNPLSLSGPAH